MLASIFTFSLVRFSEIDRALWNKGSKSSQLLGMMKILENVLPFGAEMKQLCFFAILISTQVMQIFIDDANATSF